MEAADTARASTPTATDGGQPSETPVPGVDVPADQATQALGVPVVSSQARPVPAIPVPAAAATTAVLPPARWADLEGPIGTARPIGAAAPGAGDAPPEGGEGCSEADEGFAPGVSAKLRSYVYLLVDPRTGRAFFVGRGRGDRCFDHVRAARHGSGEGPEAAGRCPEDPVLERIREVESDGRAVRIDILRYGLSAEEALLVEAAAGDALGLDCGPDAVSQRRPVTEVRSLLAKRAKFKRGHQVVLLRVGGTGADSSYEVARHSWRIGRRWIDLDSPRSPQWAVTVVGDLVAAVYRIEGWEPTADPREPALCSGSSGGAVRPVDRYSFTGTRDAELEGRYVGKSVAAHLGMGAQSPVTYVWCGPHWVNSAH
jgi:hypothetical protein